MPEQMEVEEGMGFLDMEGGPPEPPMMPQENPMEEMGMEQLESVMVKVISRFEGGFEEVEDLVENDKQDIKNFKENQGDYNNIEDGLEIQEDSENDPTNFIPASIPGASLTDDLQDSEKGTLGKSPWETPPEIENIEEAFEFIVNNKNKSPNKENTFKLLYAGIPAEAISRAASFKGFVEGLWTPDISELLIIPFMLDLVADAQEEGFTARIFNDFQDDAVTDSTVLEIMKELKPEEFNEIQQEAQIISRMPMEEDIPMDMPMEQEPMMGSFLDMEEEL